MSAPCPFLYPSFMSPRDQCIARADDAFFEVTGRWATKTGERAKYIELIDAGEWPGSAGYDVARAAIAEAGGAA